MFEKTYHATHPDMMDGAASQDLRDRYLVDRHRVEAALQK